MSADALIDPSAAASRSRADLYWSFPSRSLTGGCLTLAGTGMVIYLLGRLAHPAVIEPASLLWPPAIIVLSVGIGWLWPAPDRPLSIAAVTPVIAGDGKPVEQPTVLSGGDLSRVQQVIRDNPKLPLELIHADVVYDTDGNLQQYALRATKAGYLANKRLATMLRDQLQNAVPGEWVCTVEANQDKLVVERKTLSQLDEPIVWATVPDFVRCELRAGATNTDDEWVDLPLNNVAGLVVGGVPGSGKTVSVQTMLAPFVSSESVQFALIDGKGGGDWDCFAERAFAHISVDFTNLDAALHLLASIEAERGRRMKVLRSNKARNFWEVGPTVEMPLIIVVIDECQLLLDAQLYPKYQSDCIEEITGYVRLLVGMGRAAGVFCILCTQKPTVDSIPSGIRESAGLRICYSVLTRRAADAVLGDGWQEGGASPLRQPPGVAVCYSDTLGFRQVRSPMVDYDMIEQRAKECAELRDDPRGV